MQEACTASDNAPFISIILLLAIMPQGPAMQAGSLCEVLAGTCDALLDCE